MPDYIAIPLQVLGWGFVISLLIAFLIKGLHAVIRYFTKEEKKNVAE